MNQWTKYINLGRVGDHYVTQGPSGKLYKTPVDKCKSGYDRFTSEQSQMPKDEFIEYCRQANE